MHQFGNQLEVVFDIFHFQRIVREFRRQCLERNLYSGSLIKTLVDHAHTALSKLSKHLIAIHYQIAGLEMSVFQTLTGIFHRNKIIRFTSRRRIARRYRLIPIFHSRTPFLLNMILFDR